MKFKLILLIFVSFLLYLIPVNAEYQCGIATEDVIFNNFMDNSCDRDNITQTLGSIRSTPPYEPFAPPGNLATTMGGGSCRFANSVTIDHNESILMNTINFTHVIVANVSGSAVNLWDRRNPAATTNSVRCGFDTTDWRCNYFDAENDVLNVHPAIASTLNKGNSNMIVTRVNQTSGTLTMEVFVNATFIDGGSIASAESVIKHNLTLGADNSGGQGVGWVGNINDNFMINKSISDSQITCIYNGLNNGTLFTELESAPLPDTTPPEITFYNMTSEGDEGCTVWNENKQNPCNTTDPTPTIKLTVNLSESSYCAISTFDFNYTNMTTEDPATNCTGLPAAPGDIITCTLPDSKAFTSPGLYNISIGCKDDPEGNENLTSTSGRLLLNITDVTPPNVTLNDPEPDAILFFKDRHFIFNFTATDNFGLLNISCNLYFNNPPAKLSHVEFCQKTPPLFIFTSLPQILSSLIWR